MRILVVSGASGGHIYPALSFMEALKLERSDADILFLLPKKNILKDTQGVPYRLKFISVPVFSSGNTGHNLRGLLKFINAGWETIFILLKFKPDIVVGFGSLICIPAILSAWLFRVTTIIHEQNVIPGKANKFLARFSDKIAISFAETKCYFGGCEKKVVFTGNPLRRALVKIDKKKALDFFGFDDAVFTILVTGGSQGSRRINQEFIEFVRDDAIKNRLQVIHLSGKSDYEQLREEYTSLGIKYKCFSFLDYMHYAYSACDLAVSRAGATTITEIISFKIPAIIVPYPYAHKHQLGNAQVLEKKGCVKVIEDCRFSAALLKDVLIPLIDNRQNLEKMRRGYDNFSQGCAAEELVKVTLNE